MAEGLALKKVAVILIGLLVLIVILMVLKHTHIFGIDVFGGLRNALCGTQFGGSFCDLMGIEEVPTGNFIESFRITEITPDDKCEIVLEWQPTASRAGDIKAWRVDWEYTPYREDFPLLIDPDGTVDCTGSNRGERTCVMGNSAGRGTGDYRFRLTVYDGQNGELEALLSEPTATGAKYVLCDYLRSETGTGETFREMILNNADGSLDYELEEKTEEWFRAYDEGEGYDREYNWNIDITWFTKDEEYIRELQHPIGGFAVYPDEENMADRILENVNYKALIYLHRRIKDEVI